MDKIKILLEKAGCNPELVDQICEALDTYKVTTKKRLEEEFAAKIEQAKQACIAETDAHKLELSRRLQIFCEAKSASISSHLAKQLVIDESGAMTKLREIRGILSGTSGLNGSDQNGQVTALKEIEKRLRAVSEERDRAVETANRQTQIAEKVVRQNRVLTSENERLKQDSTQIIESRRSTARPKLDQRQSGKPKTTRATLVENQQRRQSTPRPQSAPRSDSDVASIAAAIEEVL